MSSVRAKLAILGIALLQCLSPTPASARAFTVHDLLQTEGFGQVMIDPGGRWLVFERREAFARMTRFDMFPQANILRSRPFIVDLKGREAARPLVPNDGAPGTILLGFSPKGSRIALGRLRGDQWRLGVVTLATGAVRWFDLTPGYSPFASTFSWISEDAFVTIAERDGRLPWFLRVSAAPGALAARWDRTAAGDRAAVTAIGSGRFQSASDPVPQRQLVRVNVADGTSIPLATGAFSAISLSPDHQRVSAIEDADIVSLDPDTPVGTATALWRRRLVMVDLGSRQIWRPCPDCDVAGVPVWSRDGRMLATFTRRDAAPWRAGRILTINASSRQIARAFGPSFTLSIEGLAAGSISVALGWRGHAVLAFGHSADAAVNRFDWYQANRISHPLTRTIAAPTAVLAATRGCAATMIAEHAVWCLDGARPHRVLAAYPNFVIRDRASGAARVIGWRRDRDCIDIGWSGVNVGRTVDGDIGKIDASSADAPPGIVIARRSNPSGSVTLDIVTAAGRHSVATMNAGLKDVAPARMIRLRHRLPDHSETVSWLYLPPTVSSSVQKLPLIVIPYPGDVYGNDPPPGQGIGDGRFVTNVQILAGRGYAVLLPSMPLLPAPSLQAFDFAPQIGPAVDAAIATGYVDSARMALWGHSYGAYAAATVATQTDRYHGVIVSAGIYDLASLGGVFVPSARAFPEYGLSLVAASGWAETGQGRIGTLPWEEPSRYLAKSPFYGAGRITTPMLIIAADRDFSPLQQSEQLFSALYRQGKDAELLTYWGEGHVIGSPANLEDVYRRIFAWLDSVVGAGAAPAWNGDACPIDASRSSQTRTHCSTKIAPSSAE